MTSIKTSIQDAEDAGFDETELKPFIKPNADNEGVKCKNGTLTVLAIGTWAVTKYLLIFTYFDELVEFLNQFSEWMQGDNLVLGILVLILFQGVVVPFGIVSNPQIRYLTGYVYMKIFGSLWKTILTGLVTCLSGQMLSTLVAFSLARFACKSCCLPKLERYRFTRAIKTAIKLEGFKVLFLLRLAGYAFLALSYSMGVTEISTKDFLLANFGSVPGLIMGLFVGTSIHGVSELYDKKQQSDDGGNMTLIFTVLSIVFAVLGCFGTCFVARRATKTLKDEHGIDVQDKRQGREEDEGEGLVPEMDLEENGQVSHLLNKTELEESGEVTKKDQDGQSTSSHEQVIASRQKTQGLQGT